MKSARNQFILLGLICLGFSWDNYFMPGAYFIAGIISLLKRNNPESSSATTVDALSMVGGTLFGYFMGMLPGQTTHFAIGHGLAWLQIARLWRPLTDREKRISFIIALFHLGVACTVVLDIRFTLILPAVVVLLPRALSEVERDSFPQAANQSSPGLNPLWFAAMVVVMIGFFVVFPRGVFAGALRIHGGAAEAGGLAESIMDPTRSAAAQGSRVLMQVEGNRVGYLRCFSLVDTDGIQWFPTQRPAFRRLGYPTQHPLADYPSRQVRVKNPAFLGRILPTDGRVVYVNGNFFQHPSVKADGGILCMNMWTVANNTYTYWIDPKPEPEPLYRAQFRIYTNHPPQSARLRNWVEERTRSETDPYLQAKILEAWFRNNCTYRLGAPVLSRLSPMDDFIFDQREGHCERFASALGLALRMKGIPAKVTVGYVPSSRDWFTGWINVRFRDAHAWTEAWFADRGWVQFDATPQGTRVQPSRSFTDLLDDLDFAWYAQVANFDRSSQRQIFSGLVVGSRNLLISLQAYGPWIALVLSPMLFLALWKWFRSVRLEEAAKFDPQKESMRFAGNTYGQMLQALAQRGYHRRAAQTPFEFLKVLEQQSTPVLEQIRTITELFCETQYGGLLLTDEMREQIETALAQIKQS